MVTRFLLSLAVAAGLAGLPACSGSVEQDAADEPASDPLSGLAIETAQARGVDNVPIASVPGTITLPPEARVAVTTPFPGAAVRVYVIEGQAVARGQKLALVRAAEPVQIRGDLVRAQSALGLAQARAKRITQLADEGIIAAARADEANAELAQARASLAEQRRLVSLAGIGPDGTMTLSAPIAGRIAHVGTVTGGRVDGMDAPFVIEAEGAYQVELQLPERLARGVRPGMPVEISLPTGDDGDGGGSVPVGGQIIAVSPSIDPATRSVLARASIGGAPGIVAGRNVSVTIKGNGSQAGVAIPANAVTKIAGEDHVFVREGTTYKPRKVTVTSTTGEQAVISEGLRAGEVVAVTSVAELKAMSAE